MRNVRKVFEFFPYIANRSGKERKLYTSDYTPGGQTVPTVSNGKENLVPYRLPENSVGKISFPDDIFLTGPFLTNKRKETVSLPFYRCSLVFSTVRKMGISSSVNTLPQS